MKRDICHLIAPKLQVYIAKKGGKTTQTDYMNHMSTGAAMSMESASVLLGRDIPRLMKLLNAEREPNIAHQVFADTTRAQHRRQEQEEKEIEERNIVVGHVCAW